MIDPKKLSDDHIDRLVVYRKDGRGAPENGVLRGWNNDRLLLQISGDSTITSAKPNEVYWSTP